MNLQSTSRLFVAVQLPQSQKQLIAQSAAEWKNLWNFSRWVYREDYHITLHFLGSCSDIQREQVIEALQIVASTQSAFSMTMKGLGFFGRSDQPRILWAGVSGDLQSLQQLQQKVTHYLNPIGFPPEDRPYHPHITIARKYQHNDFSPELFKSVSTWNQVESSWIVKEMALYETRLGQQPMYHAIKTFSFSRSTED